MNPKNCKELVWHAMGNWGSHAQCSRKAVQDGYCRQHHPSVVEARRQAQLSKFDQEWLQRQKSERIRAFNLVAEHLCIECYPTVEKWAHSDPNPERNPSHE